MSTKRSPFSDTFPFLLDVSMPLPRFFQDLLVNILAITSQLLRVVCPTFIFLARQFGQRANPTSFPLLNIAPYSVEACSLYLFICLPYTSVLFYSRFPCRLCHSHLLGTKGFSSESEAQPKVGPITGGCCL